jgi:hypothetical protein
MSHDWADNILTAIGASLVASVTTWWFLYRRVLEPSSELELGASLVGRQADQLLLEVTALLTNKSSVRQRYRDFQVSVRYLLPTNEIADGPENLGYQLHVPNSIDQRIGKKRFVGYAEYIDAGITFRHSYITFVPADATYLWVHAKLEFRTRMHWYSTSFVWHKKSAQRLVAVPIGALLDQPERSVDAHRRGEA